MESAITLALIGRSPAADIELEDLTVSRRHAVVAIRGEHSVILDDRSANGVWVNDRRVDEAVLRHWLLNMGRREAYLRLAHLFCELFFRLRAVGLRDPEPVRLPGTQVREVAAELFARETCLAVVGPYRESDLDEL